MLPKPWMKLQKGAHQMPAKSSEREHLIAGPRSQVVLLHMYVHAGDAPPPCLLHGSPDERLSNALHPQAARRSYPLVIT
jgi:hypothetical protein